MASVLLYNKEPQLMVDNMEIYFRERPPDCSLFTGGNFEIRVHKEVFYQTPYLQEMIKTSSIDSKIDIMCPDLSLQEVEIIVQFLYSGEIYHYDQNFIAEVSKNLADLFGFPLLDKGANLEQKMQAPSQRKKSRKQSLDSNSVGQDIKPEEVVCKQEVMDYGDEVVSKC